MVRKWVFAAFVTGVMTCACADTPSKVDTAAIQSTLASRFPKMHIVDVTPSPIASLYEVFTGDALYYTDEAANYLVQGELIDAKTKQEITSARVDARNKIDFKSLPFDRSIKIVKGDGSRKLALFTDPDCPYCRQFEEEMKSITDVTVYVFLFPLKIHPNADRHAKAIWCSSDRATAWTQYLLEKKEPPTAPNTCTNDPVAELAELARKLNLSGTPTMYFANGERVSGGMNAKALQDRLTSPGG